MKDNPGARILVVEDEQPMRLVLKDILEQEGFRVLTAEDGERGLKAAIEEKPALVLLDIMLPKIDGFTICEELRRLTYTGPILMLTAKGQVGDRVRGLDSGADDYLVKPFSTEELLARVRALLRRVNAARHRMKILKIGHVRIDLVRQTASRRSEILYMTAKEFAMLRLLADSEGRPVTRELFLDVVWGYAAFPTTRTVDNYIAKLRAKLEPDPENPKWIMTVHGVGYRLDLQNHDTFPNRVEQTGK